MEEGWLYGLFALLGVLLGGVFTFLGLVKQLGQQKELDSRQWQRKVRSEPLLKLRDELSIMAVKLEDLVASAQRTHTRFGGTQEEVEEKLHKAVDNWNAYLTNGGIAQTLFKQYDTELVNRVEEIRKDYQQAYFHNLNFRDSNAEDIKNAFNIFEKNKARIIEAQALINKRLEEL